MQVPATEKLAEKPNAFKAPPAVMVSTEMAPPRGITERMVEMFEQRKGEKRAASIALNRRSTNPADVPPTSTDRETETNTPRYPSRICQVEDSTNQELQFRRMSSGAKDIITSYVRSLFS